MTRIASKSVHRLSKNRGTINKICSKIAAFVYRVENCYNEICAFVVLDVEGKRAYRRPTLSLFRPMAADEPDGFGRAMIWKDLFLRLE